MTSTGCEIPYKDVHIAYVGVKTTRGNIDVSEQLFTTALQALELTQARYRIGLNSIVDLSEAQLSATQVGFQSKEEAMHIASASDDHKSVRLSCRIRPKVKEQAEAAARLLGRSITSALMVLGIGFRVYVDTRRPQPALCADSVHSAVGVGRDRFRTVAGE
jgi:hypothetical protein